MINLFETSNKLIAINKLNELFNKYIISNVYIKGKKYCIECISMKDFYKQSLDNQKSMGKYLLYLQSQFDIIDKKNIKKCQKNKKTI